jgi:hypothetical protein
MVHHPRRNARLLATEITRRETGDPEPTDAQIVDTLADMTERLRNSFPATHPDCSAEHRPR